MKIGRLDVCLRVGDVAASVRFYGAFGFQIVEGSVEDQWTVMSHEGSRIGLFAYQFMGADMVSLNFRNGNLKEVSKAAKIWGYPFENGPKFVGETGGSASIRDPDGHLLFFDSDGTSEE